jgi:hypothetical protein
MSGEIRRELPSTGITTTTGDSPVKRQETTTTGSVTVVENDAPADQTLLKSNLTAKATVDAENEAVLAGRRAYDESMADDHFANDAARFWDKVIVDNDAAVGNGQRGAVAATAVHVGATVMGFFVEMSGIRQVRARSGQLGAEVGGGASTTEITKTSLLLGGETLMAAANGLGVGGVSRAAKVGLEGAAIVKGAKAVRSSEAIAGAVVNGGDDVAKTILRTGNAGSRFIQGMRAVKGSAAQQVTHELQQLIRHLKLDGGKVAKAEAQAFLTELTAYAKKYGITVREGGVVGEAVGGARDVVVSLQAGAAHEMVHALQMVQVRAAAFADEAARLGMAVTDMPAAAFERANAAVIKPFEHQAYAVFESMAFKATGVMGSANTVRYRKALTEGLQAFGDALATASKPVFNQGMAARLYGELTILGRSQFEIASKLVFAANPAIHLGNLGTDLATEALLRD